jgi:hypothetical protein
MNGFVDPSTILWILTGVMVLVAVGITIDVFYGRDDDGPDGYA